MCACLLLAFKFNEPDQTLDDKPESRLALHTLLEDMERVQGIRPRKVIRAEFSVLAHLGFGLHVQMHEAMPHLFRMLKMLELSPPDTYLGAEWEGVHDVLLPGGRLRPETASVGGSLAERTLSEMHFDICVLSADSIDPHFGISTFSEAEAELNRRMIDSSARLIILADVRKFGQPRLHRIARSDRIDVLVTNLPEQAPELGALRDAGVRVVSTVAGSPDPG